MNGQPLRIYGFAISPRSWVVVWLVSLLHFILEWYNCYIDAFPLRSAKEPAVEGKSAPEYRL